MDSAGAVPHDQPSVSIAVAAGKPNDGVKAEQRGRSSDATQYFPPSAPSPAAQLVRQAEDHYQAGQLADAIALWHQTADRYEQDGDRLNQALVLSFLATALDDLGRGMQAKKVVPFRKGGRKKSSREWKS